MTPVAWLRTLVITAALCGVVAVALSGCASQSRDGLDGFGVSQGVKQVIGK